ncbi:MAG: hypothetical protein GIW95_05495 [Candidatus Eremiobacteraeota bacterium]|nr:hypothetical protein [Candidatus Eremiobacteraeota bacterium]
MSARAADAPAELASLVRASGARSVAVAGTAKNSGKTVTAAALCGAFQAQGVAIAVCTAGRDGETFDVVEGTPKPRIFLREGAVLASAESLVSADPALEILDVLEERGALGRIAVARVRRAGEYELAGPASATAVLRVVRRLQSVATLAIVDGAIDRLAFLREGIDAIVLAAGATAPTFDECVDDARALAERLQLAPAGAEDALRIEGALTLERARDLVAAGERRQIVVEDGTRIAFGGRTYLALAARLDLRAERPLHVVACTTAPSHPRRTFDPRAFLDAVGAATKLPTFDLFANRSFA